MFGLFKNKETLEVKNEPKVYVHVDDCKTVAQLREAVKLIMVTINRQNDGLFSIKESRLSKYPNLAKIVKTEDEINA